MLQIQSSPDKPPPTGRDGLMRSQRGGNAGFEVRPAHKLTIESQAKSNIQPENVQDLEKAELIRRLRKAADILEAQEDTRFIQNARKVTK